MRKGKTARVQNERLVSNENQVYRGYYIGVSPFTGHVWIEGEGGALIAWASSATDATLQIDALIDN